MKNKHARVPLRRSLLHAHWAPSGMPGTARAQVRRRVKPDPHPKKPEPGGRVEWTAPGVSHQEEVNTTGEELGKRSWSEKASVAGGRLFADFSKHQTSVWLRTM